MNMGLINWIFDIYQHSKIDEIRREAAEARLEVSRLNRGGSVDAERLERVLGELALANKTIQQLLIAKGVCKTAEFHDQLRQIDAATAASTGNRQPSCAGWSQSAVAGSAMDTSSPSSAILRMSWVIFIEQYFGPHMLQKCSALEGVLRERLVVVRAGRFRVERQAELLVPVETRSAPWRARRHDPARRAACGPRPPRGPRSCTRSCPA